MENSHHVKHIKYLAMMIRVEDLVGRNYSKDDFVFFWGHIDRDGRSAKCCLSQWYGRPFVVDGKCYCCMEQYLMAEKARLFGDVETEAEIMSETGPMVIKKLGRRVKDYDDAVWTAVRQQVSVRGNYEKFSQNKDLKNYLLSTASRILVEASPKDAIWGIGLDEFSDDAVIPARWKGENLLGFALMAVRDMIAGPKIG